MGQHVAVQGIESGIVDIGCEHAFAEAAAHMRRRVLFGKPVTAMPHIRAAKALAFARLTAMKLYAYRALNYLLGP